MCRSTCYPQTGRRRFVWLQPTPFTQARSATRSLAAASPYNRRRTSGTVLRFFWPSSTGSTIKAENCRRSEISPGMSSSPESMAGPPSIGRRLRIGDRCNGSRRRHAAWRWSGSANCFATAPVAFELRHRRISPGRKRNRQLFLCVTSVMIGTCRSPCGRRDHDRPRGRNSSAPCWRNGTASRTSSRRLGGGVLVSALPIEQAGSCMPILKKTSHRTS